MPLFPQKQYENDNSIYLRGSYEDTKFIFTKVFKSFWHMVSTLQLLFLFSNHNLIMSLHPQWVLVPRISINNLTTAPMGSLASAIPPASVNPAFPLGLCAPTTQASCELSKSMLLPSTIGPLHRESPPLRMCSLTCSTHLLCLFNLVNSHSLSTS